MSNKKHSCWFPLLLPGENGLETNSVVKINSSKSLCGGHKYHIRYQWIWNPAIYPGIIFQSLLEQAGTGTWPICLKSGNDSQQGKALSNRYTEPLDASGTCLGKGDSEFIHTSTCSLLISEPEVNTCWLKLTQRSSLIYDSDHQLGVKFKHWGHHTNNAGIGTSNLLGQWGSAIPKNYWRQV